MALPEVKTFVDLDNDGTVHGLLLTNKPRMECSNLIKIYSKTNISELFIFSRPSYVPALQDNGRKFGQDGLALY